MTSKENNKKPGQEAYKHNTGGREPENQHAVENDPPAVAKNKIIEKGGRGGLDPTRFGDWEIAGKCVDF